MHITNFKKLAANSLRKKALLIAEAGFEAIDINKAVNRKIVLKNGILSISAEDGVEAVINLADYKNVYIIGIGKGASLASMALAKILGKHLTRGIALDTEMPVRKIAKMEFLTGTHPLPSKQNMTATARIVQLAKKAGKDDLVLAFICGGGSALACSSKDELTCSLAATKGLTAMGADILELNTVRKHASEIKGGNLAKLVYPATSISMIVSDVLGNDMEMIACGPTVCDTTTKKDAERILRKYDMDPKLFRLVETPKDKKYFKMATTPLFASNKDAIFAMTKKAHELKLKPEIYSYKLKGEARKSLTSLIKKIKKGSVVLAGGETTVDFRGCKKIGKGGRNQEAVLGALKNLPANTTVISFDSDGRDNTNAAGAIGDSLTVQKMQNLKLNYNYYLDCHATFDFFRKTGDALYSKKTAFNISDLMLVIKE